MLRPLQELAILHARELGEGSIWSLIAPDALRGGEHRFAAVALLVVAVVLVTVDHDFVTDLPSLYLGADGPHDTGRVRAGDVIRVLVTVERGHRLAERRPHTVVVDAGGH